MSTANDNIGYAEAQALLRRERILKLRKKVEGKSEDEENKNPDSESPNHPSNDKPQNDLVEPQNDMVEPQRTEERPAKDSILDEELDLNQLAPRKIDWDLKRGIERKLEMLQEATNNAIAELIRDDKVDDVQLQG